MRNQINKAAFEAWVRMKFERGYNYIVTWLEQGQPRVAFGRTYNEAAAILGGCNIIDLRRYL